MSEEKIILQECVDCQAKCKPICFAFCDDCYVKMEEELLAAERRGEERAFNASREMYQRVTNAGISIGEAYKWVDLSHWRASEEYKGS